MGVATATGASPRQPLDWHAINWRQTHRHVRRVQVRIVKAWQAGMKRKVRALQFILTRSLGGRAVAVKRVTENHGKRTPGVDQVLWNTPERKAQAVAALRHRDYHPQPLKRVYIPKSDGRKRGLSIPTMKDRAMQALHLLALDPIAETTADPNSYGFRQGRAAADAISQCYCDLAKTTSAQWILEADIKACFDELSHQWLLTHLPMDCVTLGKWLKAGYVDRDNWHPTETGAPQGGIISPALCNLTLDGLEQMLREKFAPTERTGKQTQVHVVRYADDFIITGRTRELLAEEVRPAVESFLAERGLELSPTKTRIVHITEGFDFLGTHLRKYDGKLLIKPSKKSVKQVLSKITTVLKRNLHAGVEKLVGMLNPIITGWAHYHRPWVSKQTFHRLDREINRQVWRWAERKHPTKRRGWIKQKYFSASATRSWEFGRTRTQPDGKKETVRLAKAEATPIRRHIKIRQEANPYDPAWETYFEARAGQQMEADLKGRRKLVQLWMEQKGRCPMCDQQITKATGWNLHHLQWRVKGGTDVMANLVLLHPNCHRQVHSRGITVVKPRPVKRALAKA